MWPGMSHGGATVLLLLWELQCQDKGPHPHPTLDGLMAAGTGDGGVGPWPPPTVLTASSRMVSLGVSSSNEWGPCYFNGRLHSHAGLRSTA